VEGVNNIMLKLVHYSPHLDPSFDLGKRIIHFWGSLKIIFIDKEGLSSVQGDGVIAVDQHSTQGRYGVSIC